LELNPEASDAQHRVYDSEAQAVPGIEVSWKRVPWMRQLKLSLQSLKNLLWQINDFRVCSSCLAVQKERR
jgi:hypothetical protein